jgi:hypothetical protein
MSATPLRVAVKTVARDAGLVADNGAPRTHDPVEQRGLADVGPAHDGNCGNAGCGGGDSTGRIVVGWVKMRHQRYEWTTVYYRDSVALSSQPASPAPSPLSAPDGKGTSLYQFFAPGGVSREHASRVRISPRPVADGASGRAGARRKAAPHRGSRHWHRQNACVSDARDPVRQARDHLHRHEEFAGAALLQGRSVPGAGVCRENAVPARAFRFVT